MLAGAAGLYGGSANWPAFEAVSSAGLPGDTLNCNASWSVYILLTNFLLACDVGR